MIAIFFGVIIIILLIYLFSIKKEIRNITKQLKYYNENKTNKKIDIKLIDKDLEMLAYNINNQIDIIEATNINKKLREENLKQSIASISHDLRTPLTSILGYVQMLKSDKVNEESKNEYINTIQERSKRLEILLDEFFKLSLIELDSYKLNIKKDNLNNIIYNIIASFYEDFTNKNIKPNIYVEEKDIIVSIDSNAFTRVIENVISNSLKYSKSDIDIIIKKEKEFAIVKFIEYNTNLNSEDIDNMFNRFYKKDKTRNNDSTGLGLYIAKSLMQKMNGDINATLRNYDLVISCKLNLNTKKHDKD
ncbi:MULTISPECIES: sensor histidine kinase [Romboutsia]|uniref:histidine kinase n=1 Tax=Romboutsia hominis TaxID=1507512 RepID=A0A2P2BVR8_9FIRM|nr:MULTISPECIES: HAMP domain-containing sensor histidine kinase [Romboutsia]MCH1960509.1 HAMP domain-containing histidine kinase [Romboutsia hominis]MCH1969059.1 HAMP domain-containing histidine kinase [Romboutsia hominis]MDB8793449.1 HAMP domain-containing sensor histidine kinase [Romboutsia sp. 1001216sp1]MDB8796991.1 HAMP domain-containing sensor histidine kinase [Romboutsia sp. 1001216sp1]MDB8799737.1 HAMP domain-containing sensor histidine kinase [Romboutsia sp. 1001216sp1]